MSINFLCVTLWHMSIVGETVVSSKEKELYDQVNEQIQQYWELDQQAINTGKVDMEEKRMQAQELMQNQVAPLYFIMKFMIPCVN